jgi:hypothetical protein
MTSCGQVGRISFLQPNLDRQAVSTILSTMLPVIDDHWLATESAYSQKS